MKESLPPKLLDAFDKLRISGKIVKDNPLIIGGFVRDWLLGKPIDKVHDFDIISEFGKIDELLKDITSRFGLGRPITYEYSGTHQLLINGYSFEFQDPNNPHVHFPIENELRKMGIDLTFLNKNIYERDFTVDCLAYDVVNNHIVDITGLGVSDLLDNRIIRTPIDSLKAVEFNPMIILRMIRLMVEFNLSPSKELENVIPYGVTLLPEASKIRGEKFTKNLITKIFNINEKKASELFQKYELYNNVIPIPKEIMDKKVKSDMGIIYQAKDMLSITTSSQNNKLILGIVSSDLYNNEVLKTIESAIIDLYINNEINKDTKIYLLNDELLGTLHSFKENVIKAQNTIWYKTSQLNIGPALFDRYRRRKEYRDRKRREQKRDRINKIKFWRDFQN